LKLTGDVTLYYNTSYEELARKQLAGPIIPEFTSFTQGDRGNYNGAYLAAQEHRARPCERFDRRADRPDPSKNANDDHSKMLTERTA
jgi:hypothetical protein